MASTSETGHAVNIANFKTLIDACNSFGVAYNPSNSKLTVANMTTQWNNATTEQTTLAQTRMLSKPAINNREILFEPVNKLVTRIVSLLNSTDASAQLKADAKGLADKVRGFGLAKPKKPVVKGNPDENAGTGDDNFVSKSHMSFVQRVDNFRGLVELLKNEATYTPNEAELTTAALDTLYTNLKTANDSIGGTLQGVNIKLISRDNAIYDAETGLNVTADKCKKYVKGLYGASSKEYGMVKGLKFTTAR